MIKYASISELYEDPALSETIGFTCCCDKAFSLIVVINLISTFVMFDVCACLWSAL